MTHTQATSPSLDRIQRRFVALLPTVRRSGRHHFRHLDHDQQEDAVSEMTALTWKHFYRLVQRGKNPERFIVALINFVAAIVKAGKRLCGCDKSKDVMSPLAQRRHGFRLEALQGE